MALTIIGALFPLVLLTAGQAAATDYGCFDKGQGEPVTDNSSGRTRVIRVDRGASWVDWTWRGTEFRCPKTVQGCRYSWQTSHTQVISTTTGFGGGSDFFGTQILKQVINGTSVTDTESFTQMIDLRPGQAAYPYTYAWYQWARVYAQGVWRYYRAGSQGVAPVYCDPATRYKIQYQWYPNDVVTSDGNLFTGSKGSSYNIYWY